MRVQANLFDTFDVSRLVRGIQPEPLLTFPGCREQVAARRKKG
jgi:hypothetical protein